MFLFCACVCNMDSRGSGDITSLEVQSYIIGYLIYLGSYLESSEVLPLECEPNNTQNRFAVAIKNWQCC